jgi:N6-adenosine-specific RNA methylase IME4
LSVASLFDATVAAPPKAGTYQAVYADPPWLERGGGKIKRGADRHYDLMSTDDICALPVGSWAAADAHCYVWVTNNFLRDGLDVLAAWGFRYVTKIDWFKGDIQDATPVHLMADEKLQAGLGQYFRGCTESCLFGVRGSLPYRLLPDGKRAQGRTGFHASRGEHSAKPEKMRQMIERVSAGPYLELFARRPAPGWDLWGNQAPEGI